MLYFTLISAHCSANVIKMIEISHSYSAVFIDGGFLLPYFHTTHTFGQFKRSLKTLVWLVGPRRPVSER